MKTLDLQLIEFDEKLLYEVVEHVVALAHQFGRLLLSHQALLEDVGGLKIREQKDKYFCAAF